MNTCVKKRQKVLSPLEGSPWAGEMTLNPAIIRDKDSGRIHMLFRASGAWPAAKLKGKPFPYPIFLGYGYSDDCGESWQFDLEKPAMAPSLYDDRKRLINDDGTFRDEAFSNGCIEDPRLFYLDGKCCLTVACRMFPPGPYWEKDDPEQCMPDWAEGMKNPTVNLLYQVDLKALSCGDYQRAFLFLARLTDPAFGEDRDVMFFSERIGNKLVMLQRPVCPNRHPEFTEERPSIVLAAADCLEAFATGACQRSLLAAPAFPWEKNRIGASCPPLNLGDGKWLLCYHGKEDDQKGYTQSFMVLEETPAGLRILCRPQQGVVRPAEPWEMPQRFKTPCVFFTGMIRLEDTLLVSYGAADQFVGVMELDLEKVLKNIGYI